MRVHPSLTACLKIAVGLFGGLFLVLFVLDAGSDLAAGRAIEAPSLRLVSAFAVLTLGFAVIIFAVLWVFAGTLEEAGVRGFSLLGRRVTIPWADVASVDVHTAQGIPNVVVTSAASRRRVYICTLGLNTREVYQRVLSCAAAHNGLTRRCS